MEINVCICYLCAECGQIYKYIVIWSFSLILSSSLGYQVLCLCRRFLSNAQFLTGKIAHKLKFKIKIAKMKWLLIYFNCQNSKINEIKKTCQISIHGLHGEPKRKKALFVVFLSYFIYSQIWLNHRTYDHHFDHSTKSTPNNKKHT